MAAGQRNLRETLSELRHVGWSRFGWQVVAAGQPRLPADFEPRMDIDVHLQFRGEPQDRIVIRMTAGDRLFPSAGIFDADTGTVADLFFDLGATFVGKTRINGRAAGKAVFIPIQNPENFRVVLIRGERLLQCAADLLGDGPLDAHAFDEKIVSLILLDGILGGKTMEVVVPNSASHQLVPRGESVIGRVDEKLARVHTVLRLGVASYRLILAAGQRSATSCGSSLCSFIA